MHGLVVGLAGFAIAFPFGVPLAIGMAELGDERVQAGVVAFTCIVAGTVGLVLALTLERFLVFTVGFLSGWLVAALGLGGALLEPDPERFVFGAVGAFTLLGLFLLGRATYTAVVGAALAANGILLLAGETRQGFPDPETFLPLALFLAVLGLTYQLLAAWQEGRKARKGGHPVREQAPQRPLTFSSIGPPRATNTFDHVRAQAPAPPAWATRPHPMEATPPQAPAGPAPVAAPAPPAPIAVPAPSQAPPPAPVVQQPGPVIVNNNIHISPGPHGWQVGGPDEGWGLSSLRARRDAPPS